jgi:signal transduction histidine kinase
VRRISLRLRLAIVSAAVVLGVSLLSSAALFTVYRNVLDGRVDSQLAGALDAVQGALQSTLFAPESEFLTEVLLQIVAQGRSSTGVDIGFVTADGEVRGVAPDVGAPPLRLPPRALVALDAAPSGAEVIAEIRLTDGRVYRYLVRKLAPGVTYLAGRSVDDLADARRRFVLFLVVQGVLTVVLAGALGYVVTRTAMRPVRRLSHTADAIARTGDLARRVPESRADADLAELTGTFNAMLEKIESAYERLEASLQAERRLVADASHELRTPLTTIRGNVDYLARTLEPDGADGAAVDDIRVSTERLTQMVASLTELARADAGAVDDVRAVDFDELIRDVAVEPQYAPVGLELSLDDDLWVRASEQSLASVLRNLLGNAVKYGGGAIRVDAHRVDGNVVCDVRDDGPGLAAADVERVFERFWRAADAKASEGSGLGLSIVRSAVERAGGTVAAFPGPGGHFRVVLPEATDVPSSASQDDDTGAPP